MLIWTSGLRAFNLYLLGAYLVLEIEKLKMLEAQTFLRIYRLEK